MALRLSKPQNPSPRPGTGSAQLGARARTLLATGDLAGYRGLFVEAASEPDIHRRYAARKDLLEVGLAVPRGAVQQVAPVFVAVAAEARRLRGRGPRPPRRAAGRADAAQPRGHLALRARRPRRRQGALPGRPAPGP